MAGFGSEGEGLLFGAVEGRKAESSVIYAKVMNSTIYRFFK